MFEYSGAIHMHSVFSDGSGTVEEIAGFASEVALDFIILTDHNTIRAKEEGYEKWYNNTMLIVGYEVNDLENKNHYLVLGLDKLIGAYERLPDGDLGNIKSAEEYVSEVKEEGGFGFLAHPHEKRQHLPDHPAYPWTAWNSKDFDGIEIWNHMSEWMEGLTESNKLQRFLHPLKSIVAPEQKTLLKWDELNKERKVVALGSIDAHAHKQDVMGFYEVVIFPYKILFKSIRTHVFTEHELSPGAAGTFESDKKQVLDALRAGRSFIVNSYHGCGKGFRFCAEYDGNIYQMGDEILFDTSKDKKIVFKAFLPQEAELKLIKDGKCIDNLTAFNCLWDSDEEGIYRVEAWKGEKGWIFSNHIRVKKSK